MKKKYLIKTIGLAVVFLIVYFIPTNLTILTFYKNKLDSVYVTIPILSDTGTCTIEIYQQPSYFMFNPPIEMAPYNPPAKSCIFIASSTVNILDSYKQFLIRDGWAWSDNIGLSDIYKKDQYRMLVSNSSLDFNDNYGLDKESSASLNSFLKNPNPERSYFKVEFSPTNQELSDLRTTVIGLLFAKIVLGLLTIVFIILALKNRKL